MRNFFRRSLLIPTNRRRWLLERPVSYYQEMGRLGGRKSAAKRRVDLRLRCGNRVWRPRQLGMVAGLMLIVLLLSGCAEIFFALGGLAASGVGIYQRWQDRDVQKDQNAELKALREAVERHQAEVKRLNERILDFQEEHHLK